MVQSLLAVPIYDLEQWFLKLAPRVKGATAHLRGFDFEVLSEEILSGYKSHALKRKRDAQVAYDTAVDEWEKSKGLLLVDIAVCDEDYEALETLPMAKKQRTE